MTIELPLKLPSLNEYVNACRTNYIVGANMKKKIEKQIMPYIEKIPKFKNPIKIKFIWVETNKKRDFDNICFGKKFILDALQKAGKLENDNRKWVTGFTDEFKIEKENKIILEIEEVENIGLK